MKIVLRNEMFNSLRKIKVSGVTVVDLVLLVGFINDDYKRMNLHILNRDGMVFSA